MGNWVSIDFGTCNTTAAIEIDGKPHIISNGYMKFFPTVAIVSSTGLIQVCQEAEALRKEMPDCYYQEFKLNIAESTDINGKHYIDIVREILSYIKEYARIENNNEEINSALLTVPAIYSDNDVRKDIMQQAAYGAGFSKVEFLSEPEAAALHYNQIVGKKNTGISLIYDLGGGTFDPCLFDMTDFKKPQILGQESGVKCGGQYFDQAIYKHLKKLCSEKGNPLCPDKKIDDYLACKRIKESLSVRETASMMFSNGETLTLDRGTFESLIKEKILLTLDSCDALLRNSNKSWNDVKQILLVGGSTSIPYISNLIQKHLVSHNAPSVKIVRNTNGENGVYDHCFATSLGGISTKIAPPPPPQEPIAQLEVNGTRLQLKEGLNTFGRSSDMDFVFANDLNMSRKHFTILVTKDAVSHWNYVITTCSETKATVLNNLEALDLNSFPIARKSAELQDGWTITAGKTTFLFSKVNNK